MRSGSLCALLWRILTWCTREEVTLKARHIPGRLNVVADKLSRLGQTKNLKKQKNSSDVLPSGGLFPSHGTELIPLLLYVRAGLSKKGGGATSV